MAPVRVRFLPVAERHVAHARALADEFVRGGFCAEADEPGGSLAARVRSAREEEVAYVVPIGDRELASGVLAVHGPSGDVVQLFVVDLRVMLRRA